MVAISQIFPHFPALQTGVQRYEGISEYARNIPLLHENARTHTRRGCGKRRGSGGGGPEAGVRRSEGRGRAGFRFTPPAYSPRLTGPRFMPPGSRFPASVPDSRTPSPTHGPRTPVHCSWLTDPAHAPPASAPGSQPPVHDPRPPAPHGPAKPNKFAVVPGLRYLCPGKS